MKIGLFTPVGNPFATADYLRAVGSGAEARGFHSLWVAEHVVLFDEYASRYPYAADGRIPTGGEHGMLDPFGALSFLAAGTRTIRLGTGICLVPQRNPVYTAKEVATLDWMSDGRFDFGVGIGWLAEEFAALDLPFETRAARCREYLEVMKRLWLDPVSSYEGKHYHLPPCRQYPKPVQQPHPPIHFGGESGPALRRVADQGQGWFGFSIGPDDVATCLTKLDGLLAQRGRTRSEIEISISPYLNRLDLDLVKRYRDVGVDQVIAVAIGFTPDDLERTLDTLAETILEPARAL